MDERERDPGCLILAGLFGAFMGGIGINAACGPHGAVDDGIGPVVTVIGALLGALFMLYCAIDE